MVKIHPHKSRSQDLLDALLNLGPTSAKELCQYLRMSQPVFSRLITKLKSKILVVGQARSTRYALKRTIPKVGEEVPLYQINENGKIFSLGTLYAIQPRGFYLQNQIQEEENCFFADLPYFLEDLRPAGFLGRLIPKHYPEMGFLENIRHWNTDDCFVYWTHLGWDFIGNFLLGKKSFQMYLDHTQQRTTKCSSKNQIKIYTHQAEEILKKGYGGSSAAGEHPKFLTTREKDNFPVLVKFSPPLQNKIGQRYADLLVCEHIAHQTLNEYKQPAAHSQLLTGKNRFFLEIERFDRVGKFGRRGMISLQAMDLEFVGDLENWSQSAKELFDQQHIDENTYKTICWLEIFGQLIGNTDQHAGNLSFFTKKLKVTGLTPVYDMLPMLYAPQHGQLIERPLEFPLPSPKNTDLWKEALQAAKTFWKKTSFHKNLSKNFRDIAKTNLEKINTLSQIEPLLPERKNKNL